MSQEFVMKDRCKTTDGHKELSNMIRDPRQKVADDKYNSKRKSAKVKENRLKKKSKSKVRKTSRKPLLETTQ